MEGQTCNQHKDKRHKVNPHKVNLHNRHSNNNNNNNNNSNNNSNNNNRLHRPVILASLMGNRGRETQMVSSAAFFDVFMVPQFKYFRRTRQ